MTTQGFLQGLPEEVVDGFIDSILGWGLYNDAEKEESMTNKRERKGGQCRECRRVLGWIFESKGV